METSETLATDVGEDVRDVERWISLLCEEVGPRRPTSQAEAVAAVAMRTELRAAGIDAETEPYPGYSSFAWPYGLILAAAVAPALLPEGMRRTRAALAMGAAGAMALEGELRTTPVSNLLARREGRSVVATLEPRGEARRTLCLVSHLDSSRSGLLFHPAAARLLGRWITLQSPGPPNRSCRHFGPAAGCSPRRAGSPPSASRCSPSASCAAPTSRAPMTTPRASPSPRG
jgi:hypothetical protein